VKKVLQDLQKTVNPKAKKCYISVMPSQILHYLFAKEALKGLDTPWKSNESLIFWGSQGPDLFYHNQKTLPSGLFYSSRIHRSGFGTFCRHLLEQSRFCKPNVRQDLALFLLGTITHGVLDRVLHPYIIFHSGGRLPGRKETNQWDQCHPFLERILDVVFYEHFTGRLFEESHDQERLSSTFPQEPAFYQALAKALWATYPGAYHWNEAQTRVQNAFTDARGFYLWTHFHNSESYRYAATMDQEQGTRRLALYHPHILPPFDWLNLNNRSWKHPSTGLEHTESIPELWDIAIIQVNSLIELLLIALEDPRQDEQLEKALGNLSLNLTGPRGEPSGLHHFEPLELPQALELQLRYWKDHKTD